MRRIPLYFMFIFLLVPHNISAQQNIEFVGEKITYDIKKMGIKAGEAELNFAGQASLDGIDAILIIFRARSLNFLDEEKIYADPKTMYPMRVERNLNIFGKKERIIEDYNSKDGTVHITKFVKGKIRKQTIKRDKQIDNIYCFIYRYRKKGNFQMGDHFQINLPTQNVRISLDEKTNLKVGGEVYNTFFMKSKPKKYRVWFAENAKKIPLRIDGAVGFGKTSMIMTAYNK